MNDHGKSDVPVVPAKRLNNVGVPVAEAVEGRGMTKGNTDSKTRPGHRAGSGASNALDRVREVARGDKEARFTALLHHVDLDRLRVAYWAISPKAAPGVDGQTWRPTGRTWRRTFRTCTAGCSQGVTGRARLVGRTSRRRTGGHGRSASPRWRTRSPSGPSSRCSTPSTRWTSPASHMGSGRVAARIRRWMRSRSESNGRG